MLWEDPQSQVEQWQCGAGWSGGSASSHLLPSCPHPRCWQRQLLQVWDWRGRGAGGPHGLICPGNRTLLGSPLGTGLALRSGSSPQIPSHAGSTACGPNSDKSPELVRRGLASCCYHRNKPQSQSFSWVAAGAPTPLLLRCLTAKLVTGMAQESEQPCIFFLQQQPNAWVRAVVLEPKLPWVDAQCCRCLTATAGTSLGAAEAPVVWISVRHYITTTGRSDLGQKSVDWII